MTAPSTQIDMVRVLQRHLTPTLEMLRHAIAECPASVWTTDEPCLALWQHAYHSLLGLSIWLHWPTPALVFPTFHRDGADAQIGANPPILREVLEGYRQAVFAKVGDYLAHLTAENLTEELLLRGERFTRADLILAQIRHVQHHVGCMHSQLRRRTQAAPGWIAYGE